MKHLLIFTSVSLIGFTALSLGCSVEVSPVGTTADPLTVCEEADGAPCTPPPANVEGDAGDDALAPASAE